MAVKGLVFLFFVSFVLYSSVNAQGFCPNNLIEDGSFEESCQPIYCQQKYQASSNGATGFYCPIGYMSSTNDFALGSWDGSDLDVQLPDPNNMLASYPADDGVCLLDLSGANPSSVTQDFTLDSTSDVQFTFAAASPATGTSSIRFTVVDSNSATVLSETFNNLPNDRPAPATEGTFETFTRIARALAADTYTITFTASSTTAPNEGPYLDSVCVVALPKVLGVASSATCPNTIIDVTLESNNFTTSDGVAVGQAVSAVLTVNFTPGTGYTPTTTPPNVICEIIPTNLDFVKGSSCAESVDQQTGDEIVICDFTNFVTVQHQTARVALEFIAGSSNETASLNAFCTAQCMGGNFPTGRADLTLGDVTESFEPAFNQGCTGVADSDFVIANNEQVDLAIRRADGDLFACPDASGRLIDVCSMLNAVRFNALGFAVAPGCVSTPTGTQRVTLNSGFDDSIGTTPPTVTWEIEGKTFRARVFLPGDTQGRPFGLHFETDTPAQCNSQPYANAAFGSIPYDASGCTTIRRPDTSAGVTKTAKILSLSGGEVLTTPTSSGAGYEATIEATGVQSGTYNFQFTVRNSQSNLGVVWQSGTRFGDTIAITVC